MSNNNFGLPFVTQIVFDNNATWHQLSGFETYLSWFMSNPVFFSVVMIKAREYSNMKVQVVNRKTGEVEPEGTQKAIPAALYKIFKKPNPLQSRHEFMEQKKIFREVCGNSFVYGNWGIGAKGPKGISTMLNVWPQFMQFKLTGKYFSMTKKSDVVAGWMFKMGQNVENWNADEILHNNSANLDPRAGLIFGTPIALSLVEPLTNIDLAYESRNVMIKNRGMRAIITSDRGDATGKIPLGEDEKKATQQELKKYGQLKNQHQFFFSDQPLKTTPIDQDVMKLGLFEEIATDTMIVAHAFGVPEILVKLYLEGATFENQDASLRRLYQGAIIPEAEDDMDAYNEFLGLDDTEWELRASFDHITFLQKDKKSEATADNLNSKTMEQLFLRGGCTLNEWRKKIGLKELPNMDKLVIQFTPEEIAIITGKPMAQPKDEQDDSEQIKLLEKEYLHLLK